MQKDSEIDLRRTQASLQNALMSPISLGIAFQNSWSQDADKYSITIIKRKMHLGLFSFFLSGLWISVWTVQVNTLAKPLDEAAALRQLGKLVEILWVYSSLTNLYLSAWCSLLFLEIIPSQTVNSNDTSLYPVD